MAKKQTKPVVEQFDAEERARTLEQSLVELLDERKFAFAKGVGRLSLASKTPCGCVIGGLGVFVGGGVGNIFHYIEETGLATIDELCALEQGYEYGRDFGFGNLVHRNEDLHHGPFFEAGCRLRARPDATPYWLPK